MATVKKTPVKKAAKKKSTLRKASSKKAEIKKFLAPQDDGEITPEGFNGVPITRFGAIFNPERGTGSIRISFASTPAKDFNELAATVFSATLTLLRSGNAAYNGQYIMALN